MTGDLSQAVNAAGVPAPASQNGSSGTRELDNTAPVEPVELCRLTVLADSVQVDLALPTDVPISVLVPGIVGLLNSRAGSSGTGHETAADRQGRPWV
ncbi:MAG: EsaB/YukD family protein, partial [Rhodococcus sp. (in: high G+C Gram-positive bacteria)]